MSINIKKIQMSKEQHLQPMILNDEAEQEDNDSDKEILTMQRPQTYYDLMVKVGSDGPYQRNIFILFFLNWFIAATLLLQTAFLFQNDTFDCKNNGLDINNCEEIICEMEMEQRHKYIVKSELNTITTEFGPFMCGDEYLISSAKTVLFAGTLFGYLFFLFFSDNFGRKFSILMTWIACCIGIILLVIAQNLQMACVGLFLAGSGCQSAIRISMTIFAQTFDFYKRQTYSAILQLAFGFAGMLIALLYFLIKDWRTINIIMVCIPSLIILAFFIFYLEQTPKFLIKQGKQIALASLKRIEKINKKTQNLITMEDIQRVMQNQVSGQDQFKKNITIIDIFRFSSLRIKSIGMCLIFFVMAYLYFQPTFLVDDLSFNPYLDQLILSLSQLAGYFCAIPFVTKLSRVKSGTICFFVTLCVSIVLVLYTKPQNCGSFCFQTFIQIFSLFTLRFVISFYYCVLFIFVNQIYPGSARGIGFGVASAFGAVSVSSCNLLLTTMKKNGVSPHILNIPLAIIGILALRLTPQTLNKPLQEQIQQIDLQKKKYKEQHKKQMRYHQQEISQNQNSKDIKKKQKKKKIDQKKSQANKFGKV